MGTRSTVKFYKESFGEKENVILSVYQQYDGYPNGVGLTLVEFLKRKKIINGFSDQTAEGGYANGMGCLAAQYVKEHKEGIGGFYLTHPDDQQEYNYEVRLKDDIFHLTVVGEGFDGPIEDYENYLEERKNREY